MYDTTGRYAPSDTFTFQVNSVPAPAAAPLLALGGVMATRRRRSA